MNRNGLYFFIGILITLALNSFFIVEQRKQAIIFQFGEAVDSIATPGLKFKLPLIQSVRFFDNRILNYTLDEKEILAKDEKRLIVSAFIKYKITNTLKFYQTVGTEDKAASKLYSILDSSLRQVIGQAPLSSLLSNHRSVIMKDIQGIVNEKSTRFGIDIVDLRILRADLPKENSEAIYRRMASDREKEAKEFRAEGAAEAEKIKAEADKDRKIIIAEAYRKSETLKGEGDSIASKIYSQAYSQDPEFYDFYKSLNAYKNSFDSDNTKFIISPNSKFMKYFEGQ
jgi:membrane protease subunit HflC